MMRSKYLTLDRAPKGQVNKKVIEGTARFIKKYPTLLRNLAK